MEEHEEKTKNFHNPLLWWIIGLVVFGGLTIVFAINKALVSAAIFAVALIICVIGILTSKDSGDKNGKQ
jgi:hypothetical protein